MTFESLMISVSAAMFFTVVVLILWIFNDQRSKQLSTASDLAGDIEALRKMLDIRLTELTISQSAIANDVRGHILGLERRVAWIEGRGRNHDEKHSG